MHEEGALGGEPLCAGGPDVILFDLFEKDGSVDSDFCAESADDHQEHGEEQKFCG